MRTDSGYRVEAACGVRRAVLWVDHTEIGWFTVGLMCGHTIRFSAPGFTHTEVRLCVLCAIEHAEALLRAGVQNA